MPLDLTQTVDRPPTRVSFTSNSSVAVDLRRLLWEQAWEVGWQTPNEFGNVDIIAGVFNRHGTSDAIQTCDPQAPHAIPGAAVSGVTSANESSTSACAEVSVGRTLVSVSTVAEGKATSSARLQLWRLSSGGLALC